MLTHHTTPLLRIWWLPICGAALLWVSGNSTAMAGEEKKSSYPPIEQVKERVKALEPQSRLLDRWILERGGPQTVTTYRKGLELVNNFNEQGLSQMEIAMEYEANSAVFTPLFLRYINLTQAWHAYEREVRFFHHLGQKFPHSPQVQAAVAVRSAAQDNYQFLQMGIRAIDQALAIDNQNILARTLRAALLYKTPGAIPEAIVAFEAVQKTARENPDQDKMVTYYRQKTRFLGMSNGQGGGMPQAATTVAYLPERLDLQVKEIAPETWKVIQRENGMIQSNSSAALSALEDGLAAKVDDPTAFGVLLARYLEIAEQANRIPRAVAVCAELAERNPKSPQAQAAFGYVLATAQAEDILTESLARIEEAQARDPENFFIRTARMLHLAQTPWKAGKAHGTLERMKETERFHMAALENVLARSNPDHRMKTVAPAAAPSTVQ